jgi:rSAM/selenodomain-associated transferase 2
VATPAPKVAAPVLSVVVPVLNDAPALGQLLDDLAAAFTGLPAVEIVVVDGGSADAGPDLADRRGCVVIEAPRGRGAQLAAGVAASRGQWIWMLHADARPTAAAAAYLADQLDEPGWGRFDVDFAAGRRMAVVAFFMNHRSCLSGICTGDQGIFVHRRLLAGAGGMPIQPLMEDIELSRRLKRLARPRCRRERIGASPRRWQRHGLVRTVLSMWGFRLRYWLGASPEALAAEYYRP